MAMRTGFWIIAFVLVFLFAAKGRPGQKPIPWIYILLFLSGFPAMIYQIVWQRALFALYGINIQSVTIVVSAFMLGLGLGSLFGGALSRYRRVLIALFALAEFGTAAFGVVSLKLFHWIAEFATVDSVAVTGLIAFLLVVVPTVLMGATLPLLVEHLVINSSRNLGNSVGGLYFANTLGSGVACFAIAAVLMRLLGQSGSVRVAASINTLVAVGALLYHFRSERETGVDARPASQITDQDQHNSLPFPLALGCASLCGFIALAYEILWYRLLSFAAGDTARVFASLLGSYLLGIAIGSRFIEQYCRTRNPVQTSIRRLSVLIFISSFLSFMVAPCFALIVKFSTPDCKTCTPWISSLLMPLLIFAGAALFGATFPLIADVSIEPTERAGLRFSYLYAANIAGATLGSFVVGFILMDQFSLSLISSLLLLVGILIASAVLFVSKPTPSAQFKFQAATGLVLAALIVLATRTIYSTIYDRLLFKDLYPKAHFQRVVENKSGAIGVAPNGAVFGGGVYDGRFSIDLLNDVNIIVRPYAVGAFHPAPRHVLMIGLGSGSWAQVLANQPQLEELTVVEINPGYLSLISQYPAVASLLRNSRTRIIIDDGRRWLVHHPAQKFDAILMNTSFYWRNHSSNLLSANFLRIARRHLELGGILFYNTTGSDDVMATGLSVFPYAFRFSNCLVVSDSPVIFDRARWKTVLLQYVIDGRHVIDSSKPQQLSELDEIVGIPDDATGQQLVSVENDSELRKRLQDRIVITDDNMGLEWDPTPNNN